MGTECLAQFRYYGLCLNNHILLGLETRLFAVGNDFDFRRRKIRRNFAPKVLAIVNI
jgi:hypothetical protein